ncbi:hypothetical protein [Aquabacterium sp.]|uniref:hypothetical protein n=1 Tax=Aquabacterium sp. TaxID=1872578 RepID=UPI0025C2A910|nr:hypothetical protein [Aquabacterium sp.]
MKNINWFDLVRVAAIFVGVGGVSNLCNAELLLDYKFPWTEEQVGFALRGVHYFEAALNRDQVAQGFEAKSFYETINFFRMQWGGRNFYVAGAQYQSREQNAASIAAISRKTQSGPIAGGGICALFIYDEKLKQSAKHDIKLAEANGRTWCNGVQALARVKGQDALLFSLSYYLTDKPLVKKAQDIGDGWRYMTVLLKLREQDGKVLIEQDDACLGNPNQIKDVSAARKVLAECK